MRLKKGNVKEKSLYIEKSQLSREDGVSCKKREDRTGKK